MTTVFIVQHCRSVDEYDEIKLIGAYSSEALANAAVARLAQLPGFKDSGDFSVDRYRVDRDQWADGFITLTTIYVRLLNEAVDTWRPVEAEALNNDLYKIMGPVPSEENWEFPPNTVVRCEEVALFEGLCTVAKERADAAA